MKTLKLITLGIAMFLVSSSMQSQVSVNVNLGQQPSWGPVGYTSVDYYYLPDIQAYYDIRATQFIYLSGGNWIRTRNLPYQYRNYNLHNGYKVVMNNYHGSRPYYNYKYDKKKYYKGYKGSPQRSIGNSRGNNGNNGNNGYKGNNGNKDHGNKGHKNGKH